MIHQRKWRDRRESTPIHSATARTDHTRFHPGTPSDWVRNEPTDAIPLLRYEANQRHGTIHESLGVLLHISWHLWWRASHRRSVLSLPRRRMVYVSRGCRGEQRRCLPLVFQSKRRGMSRGYELGDLREEVRMLLV